MIPRHLKIAVVIMLAAVVAMGFYGRHLTHRAEETREPAADLRPVAPPLAGPTEHVTLYVASDQDAVVHPQDAVIPMSSDRAERAQGLLRSLLSLYQEKSSPHPMPAGAEIKDVYLLGGNQAVIDTNAAFADGHRSGILVEELTLASLVQTLAANLPGITQVKVLVDGRERDTLAGHVDLSNFFDVTAVSKLVADLQPRNP